MGALASCSYTRAEKCIRSYEMRIVRSHHMMDPMRGGEDRSSTVASLPPARTAEGTLRCIGKPFDSRWDANTHPEQPYYGHASPSKTHLAETELPLRSTLYCVQHTIAKPQAGRYGRASRSGQALAAAGGKNHASARADNETGVNRPSGKRTEPQDSGWDALRNDPAPLPAYLEVRDSRK